MVQSLDKENKIKRGGDIGNVSGKTLAILKEYVLQNAPTDRQQVAETTTSYETGVEAMELSTDSVESKMDFSETNVSIDMDAQTNTSMAMDISFENKNNMRRSTGGPICKCTMCIRVCTSIALNNTFFAKRVQN